MKRAIYIRALTALSISVSAFVAGGGALVGGCSSPDTSATVDPIGPDRAQFDFVAPVLERRCGSIDCHGSVYRNMRVFGYGGLRLGPEATTPETPTRVTAAEAQATYEAVVGLEPEIMRAVVQSGGAGVERLTFIRKGRGVEDHKGNKRFTPEADTCVTSWLANHVDQAACRTAGCFATTVGDGGVTSNTITGPCP
ncbi:MAG: hypothetical protein JWO86_4504 [Myxococcaceae bacterium]|nr:hypothetical protein [Myxococcaceae bacterium]